MKQTNMRQMPKRISFGVLLLLIAIFCTNLTTNAQVTIGSGEPSATGALLQLKDKDNIIDWYSQCLQRISLTTCKPLTEESALPYVFERFEQSDFRT